MFLEYEGKQMKVVLSGQLQCKCPVNGETDYYTWTIQYTPRDKIIEVLAFKKLLEEMECEGLTCEKFANKLNDVVLGVNPFQKNIRVVDNSLGVKIEVELI